MSRAPGYSPEALAYYRAEQRVLRGLVQKFAARIAELEEILRGVE